MTDDLRPPTQPIPTAVGAVLAGVVMAGLLALSILAAVAGWREMLRPGPAPRAAVYPFAEINQTRVIVE
jgi:hypothetical protein